MESKENVKIAIIGGGNVGRVLSTLFASNGYDVEVVCRNEKGIKINNSLAFEIAGDFGNVSYLVPYVNSIENLTSKKDIIIFATKSFDMLKRAEKSISKLNQKGMIVTIQNVFSIDKVMGLIPSQNSVCMVCDFACETTNNITHVFDSYGITLGVYNKDAIDKMNLLKNILKPIINTHITKDVIGFTMGRNIINGAISFLGGISGLKLKEILKNKQGRFLFCKLINEAVQICKKWRINIIPYNNQLDYDKFTKKGLIGYLYRRDIINMLIKQNGNIKSSALHELEHGEKTELRCMLSSIINYGNKTKLQFDYILTADKILAEIESGDRRIGVDNFYADKFLKLKEKNNDNR